MDFNKVSGYLLFKTESERARIIFLSKFISDLATEDIKAIIPNMKKDTTGKPTTTGIFFFCSKTIFEFRDYLSKVDFDYAGYSSIADIRLGITGDFPFNGTSSLRVEIYHFLDMSFLTTINVFGKEPSECLYNIIKELKNR